MLSITIVASTPLYGTANVIGCWFCFFPLQGWGMSGWFTTLSTQ
jgi:hypothetical protein